MVADSGLVPQILPRQATDLNDFFDVIIGKENLCCYEGTRSRISSFSTSASLPNSQSLCSANNVKPSEPPRTKAIEPLPLNDSYNRQSPRQLDCLKQDTVVTDPATRAHPLSRLLNTTIEKNEKKKLPALTTHVRKKVELPMNILGSTYAACPDSGSEENIMSKDLLLHLGFAMEDCARDRREFRIANGKVVKALGRTSIPCTFAKDPSTQYQCWFYVFQSLITPIIMGMAFLEESETLTKYKNRLQTSIVPRNGPLRLYALNNPARRLRCWADNKPILANADTGSEIDLISLSYARKRGFPMAKLSPHEHHIQFADGSITSLAGKFKIYISLKCTSDKPSLWDEKFSHRFYVLDGLTSDILLGEEFLDEHKAFEAYDTNFVADPNADLCSQVNTIVWFKTPERFLAPLIGSKERAAPEPLNVETNRQTSDSQSGGLLSAAKHRVEQWLERKFRSGDLEKGPNPEAESLKSFEARMDDRDARELHRREVSKRSIANLQGDSKAVAEAEEVQKVQAYEDDKQRLLQARGPARANPFVGGTSGSSFAGPSNLLLAL